MRPRHCYRRRTPGVLCAAWCASLFFLLVQLLLTQETDAALTLLEAPVDSLQDSNSYEKTWTIRRTPDDPSDALQALSIGGSGKVFISYDPTVVNDSSGGSDTRAIIRISGDSRDAVSSPSILIASSDGDEDNGDRSLQRIVLSANAQVVTEIVLTQPNQLQTLSVSGSGNVVVGDQVLSTSNNAKPGAPLKIAIDVSGSGSVFINSKEPFNVGSASFSVSSSGDLQIEASEFQIALLTVKNSAGDANIRLFTSSTSAASQSTAAKASFSLISSGDICWDVPNFHVGDLEVSVSGSGVVSAFQNGSCGTETVNMLGSGDVKLGNINCQHVQVAISGSGDTIVQASQYLGGVVMGSGEVKYSGQQPLVMSDKNGQVGVSWPGHQFKAIAKPAASTNVLQCSRKPVPMLKTHTTHGNDNGAPLALPIYSPGDVDPLMDPAPPVATKSSDPSDQETWSTSSIESRFESIEANLKNLWDTIKENQLTVIPASVFVAFWIVLLCVSRGQATRRRRWRRRRDPEQQRLLGPNEAQEKPVYV